MTRLIASSMFRTTTTTTKSPTPVANGCLRVSKDCGHHHSAEGYQGVTGKEHEHLLVEEDLEGAAQWE